MRKRALGIGLALLLVASWVASQVATAVADTLTLNDGTVVEGTVIDQGKSYWVKGSDGKSRMIPKSEVAKLERGGPAPARPQVGSSGAASPSGGASSSGGADFARTKSKADRVDTPIVAVGLWQTFIDNNPESPDLPAAKEELAKWQKLNKEGAEKVNGKWIAGEELKALKKKVHQLVEEGAQALEGTQTVAGIKKLEEALKLYPDSFEANFALGYHYLVKGVIGADGRGNLAYMDKAIKSLEAAAEIAPNSAAAWSNLAIGYNFRKQYVKSVEVAYKAAKMEDSKEIVQNLVNSIAHAPGGMQKNNARVREIMEDTVVLASKHGISPRGGSWAYVHPKNSKASPGGGGGEDENKGPPGVFGNGTGFFVSADGYIMTNEHVAKPGDFLMVRLPDGTEKVAERVCIDDEQDIAILKVKVDKPVTYLRLAPYDHPAIGADVAVMGFPLLSMFGMNSTAKLTRGIVTAWDEHADKCDVTVDATVNPGNSGGPMVDKHGNLLALVAMKTLQVDASISSYGLGLSTGRIRKFLAKQQSKFPTLKLEPGETAKVHTTEELAGQLRDATVCILMVRGKEASLAEKSGKGEPDAPTD